MKNQRSFIPPGLKTPLIELNRDEWQDIKNGQTVIVKQDFKRFNEAVTFVLLPMSKTIDLSAGFC